ncbi:sugar kinase [Vibrio sp.]|uniref:sugar kinase n=1 Tax=Vibrio sp. TaxID=678 RepID=UPI003AA95681
MNKKNIAIIGECMIELNGTPFGDMKQSFGGDTLNTAIYLQRMSEERIKTYYVTAVGNDNLSRMMLQHWSDEGLDTSCVAIDNQHTTGLYMIQVDNEGERSFQYWRGQSAAKYLLQHESFTSIKQQLANVDLIFLSGISLAILPENDRLTLIELLAKYKQNGIEIAFDSNYRAALWNNLKTAQDCYRAIFTFCDLALVTFDDEQLIWGDNTPQETLSRLKSFGVRKAIIKLGENGCLSQEFTKQEHPEHINANKVSKVIDTTSAGDSFNGAFLAFYANGETLTHCCQAGNLLASHIIQHKGAIIPKHITHPIYRSVKELS